MNSSTGPDGRGGRRALSAGGVALLTATALIGCGGGTPSAGPGSFSVAENEPDHLTPGRSTGAFDQIHALFAPLAKVDERGRLSMVQARSITTRDNRVWTVRIKPGWTFHNGEKVTAHSYADAWNATAYGPNGWANNGEMSNIEGYDRLNPAHGRPTTKTLSGVRVFDPTTLRITLRHPDSQFIYNLTASVPGFEPMPRAAFKNLDAYDLAPIGDGPFRMVGQWQHNASITVRRNPDYPLTPPLARQIVFQIYSDMHTAYTDAQGGSVDIISVPQDKYGQVKSDFAGSYTAYTAPAIDYLGFPLYDKRFTDVRLRQAISLSIDRNAVNKALFGGLYTPATSLTPPSENGAQTGICDFCGFDPDRAKKLLAAAGGWSGPMRIWYPGGIGYDPTFIAIANQIRQNLGIHDVTLKGVPGFVQYNEYLTGKKMDGPYRGHWGALYPSMQNTLTALFTATGDGNFETGYSNPAVDALIQRANAVNGTAATELYNQAQRRILQDMPVVPLFFSKYVYAHSRNVDNVIVDVNQIELDKVKPSS